MTRLELSNIIDIIEDLKQEEKDCCRGYIRLNPDDKRRREFISCYILDGMNRIEFEINKRYKNRLE